MIENFEVILGPGGTSVGGWTIHRRGEERALSPAEISALLEPFQVDYRRHGELISQGILNPRGQWWRTMDEELVYYSGELWPLSGARIHAQTSLKTLYAPRTGEAPPAQSPGFYGEPVPEGTFIEQICQKTNLPLRPITERDPTPDEQQIHKAIWDAIEQAEAEAKAQAEAEAKAEAKAQAEAKAKEAAEITRLYAEAARQAAETAKFADWDIPWPIDLANLPEGVFLFAQVVRQKWCRYSNEKWFIKFARQFEYPPDLMTRGVITRIGYDQLINNEKNAIRIRNTQVQQAKREKQPSLKAQPPEPNQRRSPHKSKASKRKKSKTSR
jgi:hypothetical protein